MTGGLQQSASRRVSIGLTAAFSRPDARTPGRAAPAPAPSAPAPAPAPSAPAQALAPTPSAPGPGPSPVLSTNSDCTRRHRPQQGRLPQPSSRPQKRPVPAAHTTLAPTPRSHRSGSRPPTDRHWPACFPRDQLCGQPIDHCRHARQTASLETHPADP